MLWAADADGVDGAKAGVEAIARAFCPEDGHIFKSEHQHQPDDW